MQGTQDEEVIGPRRLAPGLPRQILRPAVKQKAPLTSERLSRDVAALHKLAMLSCGK